jgi:hypothetical protein
MNLLYSFIISKTFTLSIIRIQKLFVIGN